MMSGTRRGRAGAAVAGLLAAALVLTACGGNDSTDSSGGQTSETAASSLIPEAEGTTQYPLTIETWAGESVLEARPERIAVVSYTGNLDAVTALGVTPVYADKGEVYPWQDQALISNIELLDENSSPINFEAIASTNPDLIVALNGNGTEEEFQQLADIAPVLENETPPSDKFDWRQIQRKIGEALDLQAAAEDVITKADDAIAAAAAAHPEFAGKTATLAQDYPDGGGMTYFSPTGGVAEGILVELGFAPNPLAENFVDDAEVSNERLGLLDADVLLVTYLDQATPDAREATEVFQQIPAVADGHYVPFVINNEPPLPPEGYLSWVVHNGASALSLTAVIDFLADKLGEGLQGTV